MSIEQENESPVNRYSVVLIEKTNITTQVGCLLLGAEWLRLPEEQGADPAPG